MYFVTVNDLIGGAVFGRTTVRLPWEEQPTTIVVPAEGIDVWVYERGTTDEVDVFGAGDGSGEVATQPLTTDHDGQIVVSPGVLAYTAQPAELDIFVSGGSIPSGRTIPAGSQLAAGTISKSDVTGLGILPLDLGSMTILPIATTATTAGALLSNHHNPIDASSGNLGPTLPAGLPQGTLISVEKFDSGANLVTMSGSIRKQAGTLTLSLPHEQVWLETDETGSWWPIGGHKSLSSLDTRYSAMITTQLASDPGVAAAAAAAVSTSGALIATASDDDVAGFVFTIADANGKRSVLELGPDGNLSTVAAARLATQLYTAIGVSLGFATGADSATLGVSYSVQDSTGNRSDIELDETGAITSRVMTKWAQRIGVTAGSVGIPQLGADVLARLVPAPQAVYVPQITGSGSATLIFGFNTATGVRKQLGGTGSNPTPNITNARGMPDGYILWTDGNGSWAQKADAGGPILAQAHAPGAGAECSGDSMTAGTGSSAQNASTAYPAKLQTVLRAGAYPGVTIGNDGHGSRTSTEIAYYQGGINPALTLAGGKLPAASVVPIAVTDISPEHSYQLGAFSFVYVGTLQCGATSVPGTLTWDGTTPGTGSTGGSFTFTPASPPGADIAVPAGSIFHDTEGDANVAKSLIIWPGVNNIGKASPITPADIPGDVAAMLAHISVYAKQFIIMGPLGKQTFPASTSYGQAIVAANQALAAIYGSCTPPIVNGVATGGSVAGGNFFDVRSYLIANGIADAKAAGLIVNGVATGGTGASQNYPTAQDTADMASGCVPTSLLYDEFHPSDQCYQLIANYLAAIITAKGWLL